MKFHNKLRLLTASLMVGSATIAAPVLAQTTPTAPAGAGVPQEATEDTAAAEVVVTGSRIARPEVEQASPIAVVSAEAIAQKGQINIENVLNDLPQVVGSSTGTSNNPGGGIARVNLRGLGSARTLVLVDGRRYVAYDASQVVDLNTVPTSLVERVDVVTGGRSAVYGSDAIAGVVNFIMKRNFSGVEGNASYQISDQGDGAIRNANLTIGANFDEGRGNVVAYVDYLQRQPIFASDRTATAFSYTDNGDGTLNPRGGSSSIPAFRFAAGSGATATGNRRFDQNGNIVAYNAATDLYNFGAVNYLLVPQERYLAYTKARYEINDHFKPYIEGQFINSRVLNQLAPTPVGNTTPYRAGAIGNLVQVQVNSPFIAPTSQAILRNIDATDATPGDGYVNIQTFGRRFLETGPRISDDDRNAYRIVAGMQGDIAGGWKYDGFYMYAKTKDAQFQTGNIGITALLNSVKTAFQNPATGAISAFPIAGIANGGTLVCSDAAARAAGCVPANIFGAGTVSSAAVNYISIGAQNQTEASTKMGSFVVTNSSLFDLGLGGGGIGIALGYEYRQEKARFIPDTFLSSGDVAGFNAAKATNGSYDINEFFGEVNIPIVADRPLFERLELNGAARESKYSNAVGNVFTWSAGGQYSPVKSFTLRGQYQRAIRGPNVNELFQGQTVSFNGATDPCQTAAASTGSLRALCIATGVPAAVVGTTAYSTGGTSFASFQGGNPNLKAEKSSTWTVGGVYQPQFLRNSALTIDYYNIRIDNYISTVGTQNIVNACYLNNATQYCSQITRASTGEFQSFTDTNVNSAALKTRGIDVGANVAFPLDFIGPNARLSFAFSGTRVLQFDYTPVVGLPITNICAGSFGRNCSQNVTTGTLPKWRHNLRGTLANGPFSLSVTWRYIGPVSDDDPATLYGLERIKQVSYFDLYTGVDLTQHFRINLAVNNLFNKGFQPGASTQQGGNVEQSNTYPETYDVLGRYFSIAAKVRF